jgi:crossover junction endodeoxyribonuclease RuvC
LTSGSQESRLFLGIDPGLNTTGYGLVAVSARGTARLVDAGTIRTRGKDPLPSRLAELYDGLHGLLEAHDPEAMGLEEVFSHYKHPATAIVMAHARGVLCLVASQMGVPVVALPSTRIKKLITGNGRASKKQVRGMVCRILGLRQESVRPDDVSDALAAAIAVSEGG